MPTPHCAARGSHPNRQRFQPDDVTESAVASEQADAPKAKVGYRALFRNRDYRLLYGGLAISMSGSWAYNVALVVFVFDATHSAAWVAAASMTRFLTALVASPFGGTSWRTASSACVSW